MADVNVLDLEEVLNKACHTYMVSQTFLISRKKPFIHGPFITSVNQTGRGRDHSDNNVPFEKLGYRVRGYVCKLYGS